MASPWQLASGFAIVPPGQPLAGFLVATTQSADSAQAIPANAILGGIYIRNGMTAGRSDTLPSATDIINTLRTAIVGVSLPFTVINNNGAAFSLTLVAGTGGTLLASMGVVIAQTQVKSFVLVVTGVTTPAYTVYPLGPVGAL